MIPAFLARNAAFAIRHPRLTTAEVRLMREWVKEHPACVCCGERRRSHVAVHHIVPLSFMPEQCGLNPFGRYLTLCSHRAYDHHRLVGHAGNFKDAVRNPVVVARGISSALEWRSVVKGGRPYVATT